MSYSEFSLKSVLQKFQLTLNETSSVFTEIPEIAPSDWLATLLTDSIPFALLVRSEKALSEFIIAPILFEVRQRAPQRISLFSGIDFTVDESLGLNGVCDFLFSLAPEQRIIRAPVLAVVESKKDDVSTGYGQCIAEMVAAQLFNAQEGNDIPTIYGAVTTGNIWQFLRLHEHTVFLDNREYYIEHVNKILGILLHIVSQ